MNRGRLRMILTPRGQSMPRRYSCYVCPLRINICDNVLEPCYPILERQDLPLYRTISMDSKDRMKLLTRRDPGRAFCYILGTRRLLSHMHHTLEELDYTGFDRSAHKAYQIIYSITHRHPSHLSFSEMASDASLGSWCICRRRGPGVF